MGHGVGQRLGAENLGSRYRPLSARRARADKKTPPQSPVVALPLNSDESIWGDTVTTYQSFGREPKLNL